MASVVGTGSVPCWKTEAGRKDPGAESLSWPPGLLGVSKAGNCDPNYLLCSYLVADPHKKRV